MKEAIEFIGENVSVIVDRPLGTVHPKHKDIIYKVNYGYVPDTISGDGEELDCYILGLEEPLKEYTGKCIAVIHRIDDNDDKLIIANQEFSDNEIRELTNFQEKYFKHKLFK